MAKHDIRCLGTSCSMASGRISQRLRSELIRSMLISHGWDSWATPALVGDANGCLSRTVQPDLGPVSGY